MQTSKQGTVWLEGFEGKKRNPYWLSFHFYVRYCGNNTENVKIIIPILYTWETNILSGDLSQITELISWWAGSI